MLGLAPVLSPRARVTARDLRQVRPVTVVEAVPLYEAPPSAWHQPARVSAVVNAPSPTGIEQSSTPLAVGRCGWAALQLAVSGALDGRCSLSSRVHPRHSVMLRPEESRSCIA